MEMLGKQPYRYGNRPSAALAETRAASERSGSLDAGLRAGARRVRGLLRNGIRRADCSTFRLDGE